MECRTEQVACERKAFRADQFYHPGNFRGHCPYTGPEILAQSNHGFDALCDFAGTRRTFAGCAAVSKDSRTRCHIVEPASCAELAGEPVREPNRAIQGGGFSIPELTFLRPEYIDGYDQVTDAEAIVAARRLAAEEEIFVSFSSGANLAAAIQLLQRPCRCKVVATIINDSGLKYLSTNLWDHCANPDGRFVCRHSNPTN